jgi:ABC-type dipeptide/oligopeptide/nickel transport system permease component
MKQRIKNTIAFALLAVTFAVTVADPFGAGSAAQYAANFAAICICIPAAAVLLVNNKAKKEES